MVTSAFLFLASSISRWTESLGKLWRLCQLIIVASQSEVRLAFLLRYCLPHTFLFKATMASTSSSYSSTAVQVAGSALLAAGLGYLASSSQSHRHESTSISSIAAVNDDEIVRRPKFAKSTSDCLLLCSRLIKTWCANWNPIAIMWRTSSSWKPSWPQNWNAPIDATKVNCCTNSI